MTEFVTPRKRKSDVNCNEPSIKKTQESMKPESTPKKLIRRLSTKFKIFTPTKVIKSRFQAVENNFVEECDNESSFITATTDTQESDICSSMTYFPAHYLKKVVCEKDQISNTSESSSVMQHLRIGVDLFNRNIHCGIEYLRLNDVISNDESLAELFINKKGFSKMKLFEFLTKKENRPIHRCFCNLLDLKFKTIPEVLREYLKYSYITGEYNTMLDIVDLLSHAYLDQHSEKGVMGLNISQVITILQYLITFTANEQKEKLNNRISRETFIEYLQSSLTDENKISRQLAACLHLEICETPLIPTMDERLKNLQDIGKLFTDIPKEFSFIQHHRYIICHVDFSKVILPINGIEKMSYHDRTVFLFNDILVITKKNWLYDSSSYKVKQIINLSHIKCAMVTRNTYSNQSSNTISIVQIINASTSEIVVNFYSKLIDDLMSFYTSLDHSICIHKTLIEFYRNYESRSRS